MVEEDFIIETKTRSKKAYCSFLAGMLTTLIIILINMGRVNNVSDYSFLFILIIIVIGLMYYSIKR